MSEILKIYSDDVFYDHPAAPDFYQAAIALSGTVTDTSMLVPEILDSGRSSTLQRGIQITDGEAGALAYLAANRVRPNRGGLNNG